jgi:phage terminase large subunit-like protein
MDLAKWKECEASEDNPLPDLTGREVVIGVDLASTLDLCSVSFLIKVDNERYAVHSHSFIPESRLQEKISNDKQPYRTWVNKGWITEIEGDVIDDRDVIKYINETIEKNGWIPKEVAYDDWSARQFGNMMQEEGYLMVKTPQNKGTLFEPTKIFRNLVYQGNIIFEKNDVLTWAVSNAVTTKMDDAGRFMIDKKMAKERVDPIAATIIGFSRAMYQDYQGEIELDKYVTDDYLDELGW